MIMISDDKENQTESYIATLLIVLTFLLGLYGCLKAILIFKTKKTWPFYLINVGIASSTIGLLCSCLVKLRYSWPIGLYYVVWICYCISVNIVFLVYFLRLKTLYHYNYWNMTSVCCLFLIFVSQATLLILSGIFSSGTKNELVYGYFIGTIVLVWMIELYFHLTLIKRIISLYNGNYDLSWLLRLNMPILLSFSIECCEIFVYFTTSYNIFWIHSFNYILRYNAIISYFSDLVQVVVKGKLIESAKNSDHLEK